MKRARNDRRREATPLCLKFNGRPIRFTTYRSAAHRLLDRYFNAALRDGERVDGYMLILVTRDAQLRPLCKSDGHWNDTQDMVAALHGAQHKATEYWFNSDLVWEGPDST
jgi:hypothetical protein